MFCIITNQMQANVWLTSVVLDQLLRSLILVTYASSQWRGKKFLIEHVVNVKTLNDDLFFSFSFIEIENFRGEGKILMRAHTWHNFFWKNSWFLQIWKESEQFFILFLMKMGNLRRFFSIFEVRGGNLKKNYILEKVERANPKN